MAGELLAGNHHCTAIYCYSSIHMVCVGVVNNASIMVLFIVLLMTFLMEEVCGANIKHLNLITSGMALNSARSLS